MSKAFVPRQPLVCRIKNGKDALDNRGPTDGAQYVAIYYGREVGPLLFRDGEFYLDEQPISVGGCMYLEEVCNE